MNANILIIKDSYSSGDETDWQTCKRFKIVSIKGNTMVCTVCLMDEGDTELGKFSIEVQKFEGFQAL